MLEAVRFVANGDWVDAGHTSEGRYPSVRTVWFFLGPCLALKR